MRLVRIFWLGFRIHFKELSVSPFQIMTAAVWPLVFATLAYLMFRAGSGAPSLFYASLGAAMMGIWSTTSTSAGGAIQRQRWHGLLELLVVAPAPFVVVLAPITVAIAGIGVYSLLSTLVWGRLLFGIHPHVAQPVLFVLSIPAAVLSIGMLGLVLASALILYRAASAFSQSLVYPVWLITGLLVPLSVLPGWVEPISWLLAPTWGMRALRESTTGGSPLSAIAMCIALSVCYAAIALVCLRGFERLARERATLALT
jgi:ABC-2 type transport system permease protein